MRVAYGGLAVLVLLAAAMLTLEGNIVGYLLIASWMTFAITAGAVGRWATNPDRRTLVRTSKCVLIAGTLLGQLELSIGYIGAARRAALDAVSASNMRGIGFGLREYCDRFGEAPGSFSDVVVADVSTPGQFICPWSEDQERFENGEVTSSYVYFGGPGVCSSDPRRPVAAEREDWTALALRILNQRHGRRVLFADGHLEAMSADDLDALIRDVHAKQAR